MAETATLPGRAEARPAPETVSVEAAASRLGIGRSLAYELVRRGEFPVPIIRAGRKIVVPTRALDRVLGIEQVGELDEHGASS
jgi:excisionase family DNA binding protein